MAGKKRVTSGWLRKIGAPAVLIPGLVLAVGLGWTGWKQLGPDYYQNKQVFPEYGIVSEIADGDTFRLQNGVSVRLIGINTPERGEKGSDKAIKRLSDLVINKKVFLEYDRYQDDKYGRILAWVWVNCDPSTSSGPEFLPADYMHKSKRESNPGLTENPKGCKNGKLVQEEMVKSGFAELEIFKDRGELKYEKRLKSGNMAI